MVEILTLLREIEEGGWRIEVEGDKLIVRGRPLDQALKERIKENKWLIISYYHKTMTFGRDEKIELEETFKKQEQINYQKPICKWCLSGKFLNCPDCERRSNG